MKAWVYILQSLNGKFYVGSTDNLQRRLRQHALGHTQTTRNLKADKLVLAQEYDSLASARGVEQKIKKLKRKDYIEKMVKDGYIGIALK